MDGFDVGSIISRWVHIASVVVLVGGTVFMRIALIPSADESLEKDQHDRLRGNVLRRWRKLVHACIGLLIVTGSYNFYMSMHDHVPAMPYHAVFTPKLLLAITVFFFAIVLTGTSPGFASFRANAKKWLNVQIVLAMTIILISGVLKAIHQLAVIKSGG